MIRIDVVAVAVEAIRTTPNRALLGINTSTLTGSLAVTLAVAGVVTTAGASDGIPLVELAVVTTVTGFSVATGVQAGAITLVAVSIATSVLTLLCIHPSVRLAGKDIITNTSDGILRTGGHTLAILTVVVVVATTILWASPSMLGTVVFTVTAVVVRTTSITLVLIELTVIALTGLRIAVVATTKLVRRNVATLAVEAIGPPSQASMLGIHTSTLARSLTVAFTIASIVTTARTSDGVPLVEFTVITTVTGFTVGTLVQAGAVTLVAVTVPTTELTLLGVVPLVVLTGEDIVAYTLNRSISTSHHALTIHTVVC